MKTFIPQDSRMIGIKFTGDNAAKIAEMLRLTSEKWEVWRKDSDRDDCEMRIHSDASNLGVIRHNRWVLCAPNSTRDRYFIMSDESVRKMYEEL